MMKYLIIGCALLVTQGLNSAVEKSASISRDKALNFVFNKNVNLVGRRRFIQLARQSDKSDCEAFEFDTLKQTVYYDISEKIEIKKILTDYLIKSKSKSCGYLTAMLYLKLEEAHKYDYLNKLKTIDEGISYFDKDVVHSLDLRLKRVELLEKIGLFEEHEIELARLLKLFKSSTSDYNKLKIVNSLGFHTFESKLGYSQQEFDNQRFELTQSSIKSLSESKKYRSNDAQPIEQALEYFAKERLDKFGISLHNEYIKATKEKGLLGGAIGTIFMLGHNFQNRKEFDKAIEQFERVDDPTYANGGLMRSFIAIGDLHQELGDYDKALTYYNMAVDDAGEDGSHFIYAASKKIQLLIEMELYLQVNEMVGLVDVYRSPNSLFKRDNIDKILIEYYQKINDDNNLLPVYKRRIKYLENQLENANNKSLEQEAAINEGIRYARTTWDERKQFEANERQYVLIISLLIGVIVVMIAAIAIMQAVRNKRLFKEHEKLSNTDELTGAGNRRYALAEGERLLRSAINANTSSVVCILDIDHFKQVNDTYGHDVGDKVLKLFFEALKASIRQSDVVGRFGGEEWLLIMKSADKTSIQKTYEAIREKYRKSVKASLGIESSFSMGAIISTEPTTDIDNLIKLADDNLYKSKNSGRDRLTVGCIG
ncbi:MAG: tetratricopeptide repeat-containing diguanylate cyclase [Kangiellaceae bacterium]|jgi:diguanylate cyclase (GGDEF)-like protein|nr:tetratricopeptide repeat-containing diguanylate cyclase [Kangiellaceae bacterium]